MKFPMLQLLAEGKKKKAVDADMDLDMEIDTSMEPEVDLDKPVKKKTAPKDDAPVVDKGAVLSFLKSTDAKTRKAVAVKLDAMVVADEEAAVKPKNLKEGFVGFSVVESDSAWDLEDSVAEDLKKAAARIEKETGGMAPRAAMDAELVEVAIKALRRGLKDRGNSYNTHGTLNVAMVMDERHKEFRKFASYKAFAKEVADKLNTEVGRFAKSFDAEYAAAMTRLAKKLAKWAA